MTAACKALLLKVDNYCWDVIYLLEVTVIVIWVIFIGPICTSLTACLCAVKKAELVGRRNGGWVLGVRSQVQGSKQEHAWGNNTAVVFVFHHPIKSSPALPPSSPKSQEFPLFVALCGEAAERGGRDCGTALGSSSKLAPGNADKNRDSKPRKKHQLLWPG